MGQNLTPMDGLADARGRTIESLRVSVTDRCNLRCSYCMPEEHYVWLPRPSILHYEEATRLVGIFASLGVGRIRLTGGEPLLRQDLCDFIQLLRVCGSVRDLAMTTNGVLLGRDAASLKSAGLDRLTISLDTLHADRFRRMTGRDQLDEVMRGIRAARDAGFVGTKLNTVVVRGTNDDELESLIEFGRREALEVRFIEYMDVGGATQWSRDHVVPRSEILARLGARYGEPTPMHEPSDARAPADRFALPDGTVFGVVASTTVPFCGSCGRSRLTADGHWFTCLYQPEGVDLKTPLRDGASDAELRAIIESTWRARTDRGAEERLAQLTRGPLYPPDTLRENPHREMHTRGG
jgi:cyclic pyranopterin phosphate synthase